MLKKADTSDFHVGAPDIDEYEHYFPPSLFRRLSQSSDTADSNFLHQHYRRLSLVDSHRKSEREKSGLSTSKVKRDGGGGRDDDGVHNHAAKDNFLLVLEKEHAVGEQKKAPRPVSDVFNVFLADVYEELFQDLNSLLHQRREDRGFFDTYVAAAVDARSQPGSLSPTQSVLGSLLDSTDERGRVPLKLCSTLAATGTCEWTKEQFASEFASSYQVTGAAEGTWGRGYDFTVPSKLHIKFVAIYDDATKDESTGAATRFGDHEHACASEVADAMAAQELGFDTVLVAGENNTEDSSSHTQNNAQTRKEEEEEPYSLIADLLRGAEEERMFSHSVQEQEALFCSEAFVANRSSVQPNTSDKTDGKRRADNQYQPRHFYSLPRLPLPDLTHLLGGNHPIPQHIRVFCERVFAACKDKPYHEILERREGGEPQNDPEICFAVSDVETVAEALYYRKLAQAVCTWWQRREIPAPPASHADHYEKDGTAKHAASKRGLVPRIKFLLVVADARLLLALPEVMQVLCGLGAPGEDDDTNGRNGAAGRGKAGSSLLCGVKLENEAISASACRLFRMDPRFPVAEFFQKNQSSRPGDGTGSVLSQVCATRQDYAGRLVFTLSSLMKEQKGSSRTRAGAASGEATIQTFTGAMLTDSSNCLLDVSGSKSESPNGREPSPEDALAANLSDRVVDVTVTAEGLEAEITDALQKQKNENEKKQKLEEQEAGAKAGSRRKAEEEEQKPLTLEDLDPVARKKFVEEAAAKLLKQVQNSAANREKAARRRTVTGKRVAFVSAAIENVLRQLQIGVTGFCVPLRIQHGPRDGDKGGTWTQPAQVRTAKVLAPLVKAFSYAFLKYKAAVMLSEDLWARKKANEAIDKEKLKEANLGERDREQDMEELVEEITAQCVVTAKLVAVQKSEFDRNKGEGDRQDHANSAKPLAELRSDMRSEIEAKIREGFLKAEKEAVQGLLKKSAEQLMEATKAAAPRQSPKATNFGSGSGETLAKALLFGDAAPATPSDSRKVDGEEDERDREPGDENASGTTISNSCPPAAVAHACETLAALLQQQNSVATLNAIAIVDLVRSAVAADCRFRGLTTNDVLAFVHSSWSPSSSVPATTRVLARRLLLQLCLNSHQSAGPVRESTIAELLFPFSDVPRYLLTRGGGAGARRDELQMRIVLRCFTDSAADLGRRKYWSPLQDEAALASLVMCNVLNKGTYAIPMVLAARELLRSATDCYRFSDLLLDEMLRSNSDSPLLGELLEELGIVIEKEAEPPATVDATEGTTGNQQPPNSEELRLPSNDAGVSRVKERLRGRLAVLLGEDSERPAGDAVPSLDGPVVFRSLLVQRALAETRTKLPQEGMGVQSGDLCVSFVQPILASDLVERTEALFEPVRQAFLSLDTHPDLDADGNVREDENGVDDDEKDNQGKAAAADDRDKNENDGDADDNASVSEGDFVDANEGSASRSVSAVVPAASETATSSADEQDEQNQGNATFRCFCRGTFVARSGSEAPAEMDSAPASPAVSVLGATRNTVLTAFALDLFNHMGVDIWATPVNQLSQMLVRRDIVRGPTYSSNSGNKQGQTMREMRARKMQQRADKLTVAELLDYGAVVEAADASRPSTVEVEKKKNGKRRRRERKQASSFFCEMNREPGSSFKYSDAGYLALEALLDEFFLAIKFDRSSSEEDEQRTKTERRRTSSDTEAEATLKEWETAVQNWLELSLEYDNEVDFQKERLTAADMDDVYAFSDVEQKSVTSEDAVASTRMGLDKAIAAWLRRKVRLDHEVTAVLVAPFQPVEVEDAQTAESRDAAIIDVLQSADKDDEDAANATSNGRTLRAVGAVAQLIAKLTTAFCVESPRGASRSGSSLDCFPLHQTAREMLNAENRASQQGALQLFGAQAGFGLFLAKMGQDHLAYQMLGAAGHFVVCFAGPDAGRGLVVARDAGSGSSALDAGSQARSQELAAALTLDLMRIEGWVEAQTWGSAPRSGARALNWSHALPTQLERQLPFLQDDTVVAPAPPAKRATTTLSLSERIAVSVLKQTLLDRLPQPKHHSATARAKPRFPARSWLDPLAPLNFVCLATTQLVKTSDESHGLATHLFSAHIPECKPNDSHRGSFHVDSWETKRHNLAHNHFDFVTFEIDPRFFSRKCADLVRLAYHKDYPKVVRYERMLVAERHTWDGESHSHVGREQAAVPENSQAQAGAVDETKRRSAAEALDPSIAPFDLVHVNTIYHEHSECPSGCQLLVLDAETSAWEPILFRQAVQTRPIVPTKVALQGHSSQWWYIGLSEQQTLTRVLAQDLRANRKTRFDFRIYPDGSVTRLGLFREAELLEEMREAGTPHTFFSRLIPPAMKDRKDVFLGHVDDLEEDAELENDGALVPAGVDGMQPPKTKEQKQAEADALAAKEKKKQANAAAQRWVAFLKDHSIRHFCERFHVVAPRAENHAKGHARARALLDRNSAEKMSSGAHSADVVRANMPKIRDNERVNLASERFGAKILFASDEAYGPAARLLLDQPPLSPLDSFLTQRGRAGAHAFEQVFVKLAPTLTGRVAVESICLDFSFFVEEIPRGVELYGCYIAEAEYARRYEKQVHEVNNYVLEQLRKPRAEREDQREDEDLEARLTCASDLFEEEFFSPAAIKRAPEQLPRIRGFGVDGSSFAADFVPLMPRLYAKPYAGTTITLPLQQHGIRLSHLCLRLNPCGGLNRLRVNAVVGGGTTLLGRSRVLSGGGNRKDADDAIAADKNSLSSSGAEGGGTGAGDQHQEPEDDEDESASTHPRTLVDGAEDAAERDAALATSSADEGELVGDRADADGKRKNTARGSAAEKTQRGATSVGVEDVEVAVDEDDGEGDGKNVADDEVESQAAVKIQSRARAKQARREVEELRANRREQNEAATKLQARQRGKMARRDLQKRQEQTQAATKLQAMQRGKMTRRELKEQNKAATKLQARQRGKMARRDLQEQKEQNAAATKLQAMQRGKMTRRELKEQNKAATKLQARQRGKMARRDLQEQKEQNAAATKLQAMQRGKMTRRELKEQNKAATKLQALQRGKMARRDLQEQKQQNAAATKLQAHQRGKMARRELQEQNDAATKLQAQQRGKKARRELQEQREQNQAATKLQAHQRGKMARRELQEQNDAATKLQAQQRGKKARRDLQEQKEQNQAATKLQAQQRGKMARRDLQEKNDAATKLQAQQRGKKARRELQEQKEKNHAATKLQAQQRGKMARRDLQEKNDAATKLQAQQRGKKARRELQEQKEQNQAATKLQAQQRGKMARRDLQEKNDAATKLQAQQRGKKARRDLQEQKEKNQAATKLQAQQRGKMARRDLQEKHGAATKLQAQQRGKKARRDLQEQKDQNAAATKLQAHQRGKMARRELQERKQGNDIKASPTKTPLAEGDVQTPVADAGVDDADDLAGTAEAAENVDLEASIDEQTQQADAAVKIQARARGRAVRKQQQASQAKSQLEDEQTGTAVSESKSAAEEAEKEAAAVKIQARARGRAARKRGGSEKSIVGSPVAVPGPDAESTKRLAEEAEEREKAAVKIQSRARGKAARKQKLQVGTGPASDPVAAPSAGTETDKKSAEEAEREAAAVKIQSRARGRAARKQSSQVETTAADDPLEVPTAEADTKSPEEAEREAAAVKIQSRARGRAVRKQSSQAPETGAADDPVEVPTAEADTKSPEEAEREAAAVKIQSRARGRAVRKQSSQAPETGAADESVELPTATGADTKTAAQAQADEDDDEAAQQAKAATKIQATYRGKAARSRSGGASEAKPDVIEENLDVESKNAGGDADVETDEAKTMAATKIQANYRGKSVRRRNGSP